NRPPAGSGTQPRPGDLPSRRNDVGAGGTPMRKSTLLGGIAAAVLGMGLLPTAANATPENGDTSGTGDTSQTSTSDSAAASPGPLIVGGHESTEQYDWMASLKYRGEHSCGASLI